MAIGFNEDLSTQILLRLPVKSVLKFKIVSKLWHSIVSTTQFRQTHVSRHRAAATGLFFEKDRMNDGFLGFLSLGQTKPRSMCHDVPVDFHARGTRSIITCVSSCNGLLLLELINVESLDLNYYVYNPTTKEYKCLDIPTHIGIVYAHLAFDPSQSPHYKVAFWHQRCDMKLQIAVYSSMTGTFKEAVTNSFVGDSGHYLHRGIYCNGAIHWLSSMANSMFYFNLHTECVNELRTPMFTNSRVYYFGESSGHLHFVQSIPEYRKTDKKYSLDVYELKRDYYGWFQKYRVDLAFISSKLFVDKDYGNLHHYCYAVSIFENEDDEESTMVLLINW